jgi:UPF0271 protein
MLNHMILDLNADVGEGAGNDEVLLQLVTSINVACGFHAGDAPTMWRTLQLAGQFGIAAGAHPSFPDREHFGRREMQRSEDDIFADCVYQVGAFCQMAKAIGVRPSHIKPHGALYNLACRDEQYARPLVRAAELFDLPLVSLPGSVLERLCAGRVRFIREGFADRRYRPDGSLVSRSAPDALIHDPDEAVQQALALVRDGKIETLCVHGDHAEAVQFVQSLRRFFEDHKIELAAIA